MSKSNKKILFIITNLTGGGAERVVTVWANNLSELGYDVNILVTSRVDNEYFLNSNIDVHVISSSNSAYSRLSYFQKILKLRQKIKSINPFCIISFLPHNQIKVMVACFFLKINQISTVRISPWNASVNKNFLYRLLWIKSNKKSKAIILQCKDQKYFFNKTIQEKCRVIPNPISEIYIPIIKKEFSKRSQTFIAVGRLTPQKNYPIMIEAFSIVEKKYPNITLDIFGAEEDGYAKTIQTLINRYEMQDKIKLLGRAARIQDEYIKSDIFLMSSNFEGMPNALAEAMACGLVCISTDCRTGPSELIDDRINGYLVPVNDAKALSKKMCEALELTIEKRKEIGLNAKNKILGYCSQERSVNKLVKLIDNL